MFFNNLLKKIPKIAVVLVFCVFFTLIFIVYRVNAEQNTLPEASAVHFFTRDLKIGDDNEDVRELQKFLNKNAITLVANDGPGSVSNETTYFGELTKWAVVAFQEQYGSEILIPNGLSVGTGFVGPSTRAKLNELVSYNSLQNSNTSSQVSTLPTASGVVSPKPALTPSLSFPSSLQPSGGNSQLLQSNSANLQSISSQKISVYNTSKYQVSPGDVIEINGASFPSGENILHIGDGRTVSSKAPSRPKPAGTVLEATIPADLPLGRYEIWITSNSVLNSNSSRNSLAPVYILVTNNPLPPPIITNISPASAGRAEEITITGSGFTATQNNIYSTLGNILNVSSSGGIIKVKVSDFPAAKNLEKLPGNVSIEPIVWLYVQNESGVNNTPASFRVKL